MQPTRVGALSLEALVKEFRSPGGERVRAVDEVSLEVAPGEFLTLLGPSGCGKTTTLRMLAGFEFPSAGRIRLDGQEITHTPPHLRQMAMVFQSYALFPHMTVYENIAYGLRLKQLREAEVKEQVEIALHLINLVGMEQRSPHQLSGGQQQRVALARALVMKPKVLLFDEPLSNLDAKLRAQMRMELRRLQRRLGITAVFVTHDQSEAMSLSDRIVVMRAGTIDQVGTPREIYAEPATPFVADFIGRANFIETRIVALDGERALVEVLGTTLSVPRPAHLRAGDEVYVVIRPEAITLHGEGPVRGEVTQAAYLGSLVEYDLEVGDHGLMAVEHAPRMVFGEGEPVALRFDEDALRLLPRGQPAASPAAQKRLLTPAAEVGVAPR